MQTRAGWMVLAVLVIVSAAGLAYQHAEVERERAELTRRKREHGELVRLRADNDRFRAAQLSITERERLLTARRAATAAQREIESLRTQVATAERAAEDRSTVSRPRFSADVAMPATEWKNMGGATPAAALETALWAAAGGDVQQFAERLMFTPGGAKAARQLLESLPAETRAQFSSPEQFIAFLSIKDVPTGEAKVRTWTNNGSRAQTVELALMGPDGGGKEVSLMLMRERDDADWKLAVFDTAIGRYTEMLKEKTPGK